MDNPRTEDGYFLPRYRPRPLGESSDVASSGSKNPNRRANIYSLVLVAFMTVILALIGVVVANFNSTSLQASIFDDTGVHLSHDIIFAPFGTAHADGGFRGLNGGDERDSTVGIASNPFVIAGAHDLARLAYLVNGGRFDVAGIAGGMTFENRHFRVTNDLDLGGREWVAIGGPLRPFMGNFDGGLHRITLPDVIRAEVTTSLEREIGLFGRVVNANISNVIIGESIIQSTRHNGTAQVHIGTLAGYAENSSISNIINFASLVTPNTTINTIIGGIVGVANRSAEAPVTELFNLGNYGNIDVGTVHAVGGLVGRMGNMNYIWHNGTNLLVVHLFTSYNQGDITVVSLSSLGGVGGITGQVVMVRRWDPVWGTSNPQMTITNVFNSGTLLVGGQPSHVRMNQFHGTANLTYYADGVYTGGISSWTLTVGNAFGVRGDVGTLPAQDRFFQHQTAGQFNPELGTVTTGQHSGQNLLGVLESGRHGLGISNFIRSAEWTGGENGLPAFAIARLSFGNVRLVRGSPVFQIEDATHVAMLAPGNFIVGSAQIPNPTTMPNNVRFAGWATSASLARAGVVTHAPGGQIIVTATHTHSSPLVLYAVYAFIRPIALTVNPGDGILVPNDNRTVRNLDRPDDFSNLLARRSSPVALHTGWATSLRDARLGIVHYDIRTDAEAYRFFEDTQLFAVWQRQTPSTIIFIYSNTLLGINQPTRMIDFTSAHYELDLADFAPTVPTQSDNIFRGFARNAADAARGIVHFRPGEEVTVSVNSRFYAVWNEAKYIDPTIPGPNPVEPEQLSVPQNVGIVGNGMLMWGEVIGSASYRIYINDAPWATISENNFIDLGHFGAGSYRLRVRAIAAAGSNFLDSNTSDTIIHRVGGMLNEAVPPAPPAPPPPLPDGVSRLRAPREVRRVGESVLVWSSVDEALDYVVYINGIQVATTDGENHFAIDPMEFAPGTHLLSVRAVGNNVDLLTSNLSMGAIFSINNPFGGGSFVTISDPWWLSEIVMFAMIIMFVGLSVALLFVRRRVAKRGTI